MTNEERLAHLEELTKSLEADNAQLQDMLRNQIQDFEVRVASLTAERDNALRELEQVRWAMAGLALQ